MEDQKTAGSIDNPETVFQSSPPSSTVIHEETGSAANYSPEAEEKRPALSQRLTEAFREGMASTKQDYVKSPDVVIKPKAKKIRQETGEAAMLDKVIREGKSVAAVAGNKVANAAGTFLQLAKKAPSMTQKYADAYREGAASVKTRASKERREEGRTVAKKKESPADGRSILNRLLQAGGSAAGIVREAISAVKPGEVIGARQKIRLIEKKINQLYIDIGGEAVNSFRGGIVESEKLSALLDSLRQNEAEILTAQEQLTKVEAAGKKEGAGRPKPAKKKRDLTPVAVDQTDQELGSVAAGVTGAQPDEPFRVDLPQQDDHSDVAPVPDAVDLCVAVEPDSEAPACNFGSEDKIDEAAAPQDKSAGEAEPAIESSVAITSLLADSGQEESDSEAEPILPEEFDIGQEKYDEREKDNYGK